MDGKTGLSNEILIDYPRNNPAKFGLNWPSGFKRDYRYQLKGRSLCHFLSMEMTVSNKIL